MLRHKPNPMKRGQLAVIARVTSETLVIVPSDAATPYHQPLNAVLSFSLSPPTHPSPVFLVSFQFLLRSVSPRELSKAQAAF